MGKIIRRLIVIIVVLALVCGGIYGGLTFYRNSQRKPVPVYSVTEVIQPADSFFFEEEQAYGSVAADRIQSVFVSSTQNVKEVLVSEGDTVKKGDVLVTYDTTLSDIALEKAEIELAQQELALRKSEEELAKINQLVPSSDDEEYDDTEIEEPEEPEPTETPTPEPQVFDPQTTGVRISGSGTIDDPYIYLWGINDALTNDELLAMFTEDGVLPEYDEEDDEDDGEAGVETGQAAFILTKIGLLPVSAFAAEGMPVVEEGTEVPEAGTSVYGAAEDSSANVENGVEITSADTENGVEVTGPAAAENTQIYAGTLEEDDGEALDGAYGVDNGGWDGGAGAKTVDDSGNLVEVGAEIEDGSDPGTADEDFSGTEIETGEEFSDTETETGEDENWLEDGQDADEEFAAEEPSYESDTPGDVIDPGYSDDGEAGVETGEEFDDVSEEGVENGDEINAEQSVIENDDAEISAFEDGDYDPAEYTEEEEEAEDESLTDDDEFAEEEGADEEQGDEEGDVEGGENGTSPSDGSSGSSVNPNAKWLKNLPNELFVILEIHKYDNIEAPVLQRYGMYLIRDGRDVAVRLYNPDAVNEDEIEEFSDPAEAEVEDGRHPERNTSGDEDDEELDDELLDDFFDDDDEDYDDSVDDDEDIPTLDDSSIDFTAHYTAQEIEEMKLEKQKEVRDATIEFKMAEISLREMKAEASDGSVRSKVNGVVKTVRDPDEAKEDSSALIVVSGGGGYYVTISVGELDLSTLEIGQSVEVSGFNNENETYAAHIEEMSYYPTSASDGWSNGNPNVSYYPCKVIVDDAECRSGDYGSVKYSNTGQEDTESYYLESMFVRSDAGGRYVYVQDKDGLLKRRNIQTGKSPDSYVVEVKSGLSEDDYIAFPYGSNVEEGAQTEQVSIDELYSY